MSISVDKLTEVLQFEVTENVSKFRMLQLSYVLAYDNS